MKLLIDRMWGITFDGAIWLEELETGGCEESLDLIFYIFRVASRIKDSDLRWIVSEQRLDNLNSRRFSGVASVFLESISKNADLPANECSMEVRHNSLHESVALKFIDGDDLHPIIGNLFKVESLCKIDERKNIFLEARTSKAETGLQKFRAKSNITTDSFCNFVNVSTSLLTDGADCVDTADTLRQHGICDQLRELG